MYDAAKVRALNDEFRRSLQGGKVLVTNGILALPQMVSILDQVKAFGDFSAGTDPHGEHDFGAFTNGGQQIFWKIDYYDADLVNGSPDPTDVAVTTRVMTIMLAEEY